MSIPYCLGSSVTSNIAVLHLSHSNLLFHSSHPLLVSRASVLSTVLGSSCISSSSGNLLLFYNSSSSIFFFSLPIRFKSPHFYYCIPLATTCRTVWSVMNRHWVQLSSISYQYLSCLTQGQFSTSRKKEIFSVHPIMQIIQVLHYNCLKTSSLQQLMLWTLTIKTAKIKTLLFKWC